MIEKKHKRLFYCLIFLVLLMCLFAYSLVPMYRLICEQTGLNGKTGTAVSAASDASEVDTSRVITVQFVATRNAQLPWKFYPKQTSITLHPGENKRVTFFAENDSSRTMVVQAIPSVTPGPAARYLKKTECFCFTQQVLASGKAIEMPVLFHIDKDLPADIHTVTLSYTLFDATEFAGKNNAKLPGRLQ